MNIHENKQLRLKGVIIIKWGLSDAYLKSIDYFSFGRRGTGPHWMISFGVMYYLYEFFIEIWFDKKMKELALKESEAGGTP